MKREEERKIIKSEDAQLKRGGMIERRANDGEGLTNHATCKMGAELTSSTRANIITESDDDSCLQFVCAIIINITNKTRKDILL